MRTEIIYEDKDICVIRKPAGLATQTAKIGEADVVSELKNYFARASKGAPYAGVVHRLDQPVEGLLVFGKNKAATGKLTEYLRNHTLNKQYLAVVCGKPAKEEGTLVDYLYKDAAGKAQIADAPGENGSVKAVLTYRTVKTFEIAGKSASLLDITIDTGRFHQIRAQMSHAGFPLLGDRKYGNADSAELSALARVTTVALCANRITLRHPTTGKEMSFEAVPTAKIYSCV